MWRNYMTVGWRTLVRNKTYAAINVFGLVTGLAACLLLLLYVRYETTYDRWLPDAERTYQVQSVGTGPEDSGSVIQGTHGIITESLPREFPEIEAITRADSEQLVLLRNGEPVFAPAFLVDPSFFDVLQLPFLRGDRRTALAGMDGVAMSRTEAIRQFGTIDAVGRTITGIRRGEQYSMRVTGVFEDVPRNSHLDVSMVRRITDEERADCGWGCINGYVYLRLRTGADAASINARLGAWERRSIPPRNVGGQRVSEGDLFDWRLTNVRDVHLSGAEGELERPGNDRRTLITFAVVALLILGMATVNFVNLATARASQRAREVALRKVVGANRGQLVFQFLGESLLITAVSMLIALAFVELAVPYLAAYLNAGLEVRYFGADAVLLPIAALWLAVGLAGGLYPAFYLSRFRPGEVLKANKSSAEPGGTGRLRGILVVAQFAVSIGLIVCTIIVYRQTVYAQTTDLGFQREGLIQVGNMNRASAIRATETLMRQIGRVEGVESVAAGSISVASGTTLNTNVQAPGLTAPPLIGFYSVSPEFFGTMRIPLRAGRALSRVHASDNAFTPFEPAEAVEPAQQALARRGFNIVVNELAARRLGFATPAAALGRQVRPSMFDGQMVPATIVGVVADSRFRSLREEPEPMIFHDRGIYRTLIIRYRSDNPEALRQQIGRVWRQVVPDIPFEGEFADAQLAELYATDAARGRTFFGFAMLAVMIACLGLFGLAAFTAERRTKEIGIRKVFGASTRDIVQLLVWQFTRPVIVANLIAWPVSWWVMRDWLNTFDSRIALTPTPFVVAGLLAFAVAVGTIAGHAIRVARANPIHALRYE